MFQTGIVSVVKAHTAKEAVQTFSPDGKSIATVTLGVGGGSDKYPVMWVNVPVWEKLAEQALDEINSKGVRVEAKGMLRVRTYEGKRGTAVAIDLNDVRELRIYDRDGELEKVLSG